MYAYIGTISHFCQIHLSYSPHGLSASLPQPPSTDEHCVYVMFKHACACGCVYVFIDCRPRLAATFVGLGNLAFFGGNGARKNRCTAMALPAGIQKFLRSTHGLFPHEICQLIDRAHHTCDLARWLESHS